MLSSDRASSWLVQSATDFYAATRYTLATPTRAIITTTVSTFAFGILILSIFPAFSYQMLTSEPSYWGYAFTSLLELLLTEEGVLGPITMAAYAIFTGVSLVNLGAQMQIADNLSARGLLTMAPGLLTAGCVSCGAGILGVLGLAGALTLIPFDIVYLRIAGIGLLVYFLAASGHPTECRWMPK
jgi:ABC-type antimicrobial peptide transport system permease subunit